MKVSVIVPVYNVENYLEQCLNSLLNQTMDDYEIICVNDGSTDSSPDILKRYSIEYSDKITVLTTENAGQGHARNLGLKLAKGEYIGFVDSDDWIDNTMYEKLYNIASEKNADIAICRVYECLPDGDMILEKRQYSRVEDISSCIWNKLFRKEIIRDLQFPEGLWYEDFAFGIQAVNKTKYFAFVDEGLYFYRIGHASTMTNRNALKNLDILSICDLIYDYYVRNNLSMESYEYLILNHVLIDAIRRVSLMRVSESGNVIKKLRGYVRKRIPTLITCQTFINASASKKVALFLNYHGLESITTEIIRIKKLLK